eukprot:scpid73260/ scgid20349/ 
MNPVSRYKIDVERVAAFYTEIVNFHLLGGTEREQRCEATRVYFKLQKVRKDILESQWYGHIALFRLNTDVYEAYQAPNQNQKWGEYCGNKDKHIKDLQKELRQTEKSNSEKLRALRNKVHEDITDKNNDIKKLEGQVSQLEEKNTELEDQVKKSKDKSKKRRKDVKQLEQDLEAKEEEHKSLLVKIEEFVQTSPFEFKVKLSDDARRQALQELRTGYEVTLRGGVKYFGQTDSGGEKNGYWIWLYSDGGKKVGQWKDGMWHGYFKDIDKEGVVVRRGYTSEGKEWHGLVVEYDKEASKFEHSLYEDDEKIHSFTEEEVKEVNNGDTSWKQKMRNDASRSELYPDQTFKQPDDFEFYIKEVEARCKLIEQDNTIKLVADPDDSDSDSDSDSGNEGGGDMGGLIDDFEEESEEEFDFDEAFEGFLKLIAARTLEYFELLEIEKNKGISKDLWAKIDATFYKVCVRKLDEKTAKLQVIDKIDKDVSRDEFKAAVSKKALALKSISKENETKFYLVRNTIVGELDKLIEKLQK